MINTDNVKYFLMFMGYPRSGHTLAAAILNAHPNIVCSNQQYILQNINSKGLDSILNEIEAGTPRSQWNPNAYIEPCPKDSILVVGDKTGHRTIEHLLTNPGDLDEFKKVIPWPIKWIHVVRNPFDCLATWAKKNHDSRKNPTNTENEFNIALEKFKVLNFTIQGLKQTEDVLTVLHERVVVNKDKTLDEFSNFLEVEKTDAWRQAVVKTLWKKPRITRRNINWTPQMRAKVTKIIKQYHWLNGYYFGG